MTGSRIVSDGFLSLEELRGRRVLVIGLGISGRAVAAALVRAGAVVFASDAHAEAIGHPEVELLREQGVEIEGGTHKKAGKWMAQAELVIPSPGITPRSGILSQAIADGVPVLSEIELAFRFTRAPIVAVTGTNGKTTTIRLTAAALAEDGRRVVTCGNIGHPFISAAIESPDADVFVVEVSSFQLTFCYAFHPHVAVITNFAEDHLDWHGTMNAYKVAKSRIASRQTRNDWFIYPEAQPELADLAPVAGPRRVPFSMNVIRAGSGVWLDGAQIAALIGSGVVEHIGGVENLARLGRPSVEDGLAAAAAALCIGAAPDAVGRALGSYQPDHHRLENVGELEGVRFVDDSKATNPHATLAALQSFERVVLIAGGRSKGTDLGALRQAAGRIRAVVAIGESAKQIERTFSEAGKPVRLAKSMDDAVREAFALAEPGDVVLLSPACSSFDMFNDYGHRGDVFRESYEHLADSAEKEEK